MICNFDSHICQIKTLYFVPPLCESSTAHGHKFSKLKLTNYTICQNFFHPKYPQYMIQGYITIGNTKVNDSNMKQLT